MIDQIDILRNARKAISGNLVNLRGWQTNRKIVVIESDDWGSIRMPSKDVYKKLLAGGIRVDRSIYDTYDILEQREDLEYLFNTLISFEDVRGNHPIFTFNTVMGNPAFNKIEKDQFNKYHHEDFVTSYWKYNKNKIIDLWYSAIDQNLIRPQFHAREHLNVSLWMEALRRNNNATLFSFKHNFFGLKTQTPSNNQNNYLAAFWPDNEYDYKRKINVLKEGLKMFKKKFGYTSESFVACNYIFPKEMEKPLYDLGVKFIQTQRGHISPNIKNGNKKVSRCFTGQISNFNQYYLVRNCFFEPTLYEYADPVDSCLKEIEVAFKWNKPAILSSHRINYVGGISTENRDKGLSGLHELLTRLLKNWPDIEFLSTDELGRLINMDDL